MNKEQILESMILNAKTISFTDSDVFIKKIKLICEYFNWNIPLDFLKIYKTTDIDIVMQKYGEYLENNNTYSIEAEQYLKNSYNTIYHITNRYYADNILKYGLIPKYNIYDSNKFYIVILNEYNKKTLKENLDKHLSKDSIVLSNKISYAYKDNEKDMFYVYDILDNWKEIKLK